MIKDIHQAAALLFWNVCFLNHQIWYRHPQLPFLVGLMFTVYPLVIYPDWLGNHPFVTTPQCPSTVWIFQDFPALFDGWKITFFHIFPCFTGLRHDPAVILEPLVRDTKGYARDPWTNFWTHEALGIMAMPMAMSMAMSGTLWKTNITMENQHF